MSKSSRIAGFYRMSIDERIAALLAAGAITADSASRLQSGSPLLPAERAERMIENVIGTFSLPFGVATGFLIDGKDYFVPMVVEEPSIVAGLSSAAKLARAGGGFSTACDESLLAGQIHLLDVAEPDAAQLRIASARDALLSKANDMLAGLVRRGGGARDVNCRVLSMPDGRSAVVVHIYVDACDAMGANLVNTVCEGLAGDVEALVGGRSTLRILSNLADRSLVTSRVQLPLKTLAAGRFAPEQVRDGIVAAADLASIDPYRACTHNKGVMNGIDPLAIATGNDWRAIEAAAHAWAARDGTYRSLTHWQVDDEGNLAGSITLPLKPGIVGGSLKANPGVSLGLQIAAVDSAAELAAMMASVGLAQNFAALRALVTHGIQHGHMRLHARSVATTAEVPDALFDKVVTGLIDSGEIKTWKAEQLVSEFSATGSAEAGHDESEHLAEGVAAGKVILLGEHSAVYDKHVVALPLNEAVRATVSDSDNGTTVDLVEPAGPRRLDLTTSPGTGLAAMLDLIVSSLNVPRQEFAIRITVRIPAGMGLGSSAAFAVAIIRALVAHRGLKLDDAAVNRLAFDCEKLAHGTPSGIDNTLATYGKPVLYQRSAEPPTRLLELREPPPIVIASSGRPGITRDQVAGVQARRARQPQRVDALFEEMDALSLDGARALQAADYAVLGELMNLAHGYLNAIGVSTPALEAMVATARSAGAVGAKLTGAGGGGSMVALCPGTETQVANALESAGYDIVCSVTK